MALLHLGASRSVLWVILEAFGGSIFSSIGLLVIAGLIGPRNLGLSALVLAIVQTVNFFPDTLFHDAIIQRRRLNARHVGSAFWLVCMLAVALGAAIAALAYPVSRLYREPELALLLLSLSVTALATAIASIQTARLRRALRFRALAYYTVFSRATATIVGLALAITGFGPWAIVAQYGLSSLILAASLLGTTRWRFARHFSLAHAQDIGVFALTRTACHFADATRGRLFFALLGSYLPIPILGEFNLAFRVVDSITSVVATSIARFCLPRFSRVQHNIRAVAASLLTTNVVTAAILMPPFAVLALTGNDMVHLFASAAWREMGGLLPWLTIGGMAVVLVTPANAAILAVGRPLLVAIAAGVVVVALMAGIIAFPPGTGIDAVMCWTLPLLTSVPIGLVVTRYAIGIGIPSQIAGLWPAALLTVLACAATLLARLAFSKASTPLLVFSEVVAAGTVYVPCIIAFLILLRDRMSQRGWRRWFFLNVPGEAL